MLLPLPAERQIYFSEVKKMETKRNNYDVFDEVISPDNVMNIGELIALKTVQRLVLIKAPEAFT